MPVVQNNYCTTDYCLYAYCVPTGYQALKSQVSLVDTTAYILNCMVRMMAYNVTNFRILWEFKSDGTELNNFTASTSETGRPIVNIKSDTIEKVWRSTSDEDQWVQWDAGSGRTISLDTLGLIATNFTPDVSLILKGSGGPSDPAPGDWSVVSTYATITSPADIDEVNRLWCSPSEPASAYRHWRLEIDDPTNPDGYVEIGRLVAGSALIFDGENCIDELEAYEVNYADRVRMTPFSEISNERAMKRVLNVKFRNLNIVGQANYNLLKRYLRYCRDTLKALVIVDPSDEAMMYEFSIFAKLTRMPPRMHKFIDTSNVYSDLQLEYDEAK